MRTVLFSFTLFIALLALLAEISWSTEFCVETNTDLQKVLSIAESNGEDDIIRVVAGQYAGGFGYESNEGHSITLLGGYTTGCTCRKLDPSNTILDGNGRTRVLYLKHRKGCDITLEGLTLKNSGYAYAAGGGLYVSILSTNEFNGNININKNIITDNYHRYCGGIEAITSSESGSTGNITISNNVISDNTAEWYSGGIKAESSSTEAKAGDITLINNRFIDNRVYYGFGNAVNLSTTGHISFVNNIIASNNSFNNHLGAVLLRSDYLTIAHNTITENNGAWGVYAESLSDFGHINFFNNIIWGNGRPDRGDIFISGFNIAQSYNNDFSVVSAIWTNASDNIDTDPLFTDIENYDFHLLPDSPVIDLGTSDFKMLDVDFEGDPRITGEAPDMGADEYTPNAQINWTLIHGELDNISAGSADHVWGVHETGQIFRWDSDHWTRIDGELKQVSVGWDGTVWGVHHNSQIFRRDGDTWTLIHGELDNISVGSADHVWGVHETGQIFRWDSDHWTRIDGELKQVSVGWDGTVWGVHETGQIFRWDSDHWTRIDGELKQVSVGWDGTVWGVHETGQIFRWDNGHWIRIDGELKQVSIDWDGTVWGVHHNSQIFRGEFIVPGTAQSANIYQSTYDLVKWGSRGAAKFGRLCTAYR